MIDKERIERRTMKIGIPEEVKATVGEPFVNDKMIVEGYVQFLTWDFP